MRFNKLLAVVPFAFIALVGCKPSCEGMCDKMQDEDCKDFDHDSCMHLCIMVEDMQEDTDKCDDEYDALISCYNDQDDICKTQEFDDDGELKKCKSESKDFVTCMSDYCADHDSSDYCKGAP